MAERLKAHVLKTCLGHTNVGSNPTPSAESRRLTSWKVFKLKVSLNLSTCNLQTFKPNIGEVPERLNGLAC